MTFSNLFLLGITKTSRYFEPRFSLKRCILLFLKVSSYKLIGIGKAIRIFTFAKSVNLLLQFRVCFSGHRGGVIGRIRLSVSTVNRTYELSGITHVTPFRKYGKHSTGPSTYGPWARTYSKLFSCKPVLTVCGYGAQSNEICTYGRVSRGTIPRVRRYGLLYLRTVEYDHWACLPVCKYTNPDLRFLGEWPTWHLSIGTENIPIAPVLRDREPVYAESFTPANPSLQFVVTKFSRIRHVFTEWCQVGHLRKFIP